jgi:hypothetical protein
MADFSTVGQTAFLSERLLNLEPVILIRARGVVNLLHPDFTHRIAADRFITTCKRFAANPELTRWLYRVQSAAGAATFQALIASLGGSRVGFTEGNDVQPSQLCEEFDFDAPIGQMSVFQPSAGLRDAETRRRI